MGKGEEAALGSPLACPQLEWRAQGQSVVLLLSPAQHEWTPPPPGHSQPRGKCHHLCFPRCLTGD